MPDTHRSKPEAREMVFEKLSALRAGMLGIHGQDSHMKPMTHFVDADEGIIWFITSRQTELATQVGQGATAHYCLVDDKDGFYACLSGPITQSSNTEKLDELWNVFAAAWFEGRDDPDLLLLKMSLNDAEVWSSTDSGFHFGLEIARANLDPEKMPDVGSHDRISF